MTPARILRAAEVLRDEAQCLKESYGRPPDFEWPEDEDRDVVDRKARADHDEMLALAGELEEMARGLRAMSAPPPEPALPHPSPPPPVDRSQRTLTDGSPVPPDHRELKPNGQQKGYVVLSDAERAKGFVRQVRRTYTHKTCGTDTTMGLALAETYARDPSFYSGTFCYHCGEHFPLDQFVWAGTDEQVGS